MPAILRRLRRPAPLDPLTFRGGHDFLDPGGRKIDLAVRRGRLRCVGLDERAVVRHQPVHLDLDVGRLRVDGGGEPGRADQGPQALDQGRVGARELFTALVGPVAPVLLVLPGVAAQGKAQASELPEHGRAMLLGPRRAGARVDVDVVDVAGARHVVPAAGARHQPRRVLLLDEIDDPLRIVLSPALVERHPHHDRRVVRASVDQRLELRLELPRRLRGARDVGVVAADVAVAARHVLPDQEAELVAMVVPAVGLHLHVLPGHVEAELLRHLDVVPQRLVGRGGVDAVGPKALVEGAELEEELVVEEEAGDPILVLSERNLAQAEVARDLVHGLAALDEGDLEAVEERRVGGPELWVRNGKFNRQGNWAGDISDAPAAIEHGHAGGIAPPYRACHADVHHDERRWDLHVRAHGRGLRLLLGLQRVRPARRRDHD